VNSSVCESQQVTKKANRARVSRCSSPSHFQVDERDEDSWRPWMKNPKSKERHQQFDRIFGAVANMYYRPQHICSPNEKVSKEKKNETKENTNNKDEKTLSIEKNKNKEESLIGSPIKSKKRKLKKEDEKSSKKRGKKVNVAEEALLEWEMDNFEYSTFDLLQSPLRKDSVLDIWSPGELAIFEAGICALGKDFHAIQKLIKTKTTNQLVDLYYFWKISSHYQMWKEHKKPTRRFHNGKQEQWDLIQGKMKGFNPSADRILPSKTIIPDDPLPTISPHLSSNSSSVSLAPSIPLSSSISSPIIVE